MRQVPLSSPGSVRWGVNPQERMELLRQQLKDLAPLVEHVGDREQELQQDLDEIGGKIQLTRQQIQERIAYLRQFSKEAVPGFLEELQAMHQRLEALGSIVAPSEEPPGDADDGSDDASNKG